MNPQIGQRMNPSQIDPEEEKSSQASARSEGARLKNVCWII
jgi:hypothetical protein